MEAGGKMTMTASRARTAPVLLLAALAAGCGGGHEPVRGGSFDQAFRLAEKITLEGSESDPLVEITDLTVRPDGTLLVVDGPASRIRAFEPSGDRLWSLGGPGEGPGELEDPRSVAAGPDGRIHVVQRGGPRVTVFEGTGPERISTAFELPGNYGHWAARLGDRIAVGIGTRDHRFAVLTLDGQEVSTFGLRRPDPQDFPAGNFIMEDHAAVMGDEILVNTSFSPVIRVHGAAGDSLRSFGEPPPSWEPPTPPSPGGGAAPEKAIRDWMSSLTVVTGLLVVRDSLVVVQYGRFDPGPEQPYRKRLRAADVYGADGRKLYEALTLEEPVLAGGERLYTLGGQPPGPWTLNVWEGR